MSKGMRWWLTDNTDNSGWSVDTKFSRSMFGSCNVFEVMVVTEHERVVAELRAEVFDLKSVQESLIETAAKNEDYYEFELSRLRELVAKQAKVIEKIKTIAEKMDCTCGSEGHSDTSYRDGGCFQREILESIERGEA